MKEYLIPFACILAGAFIHAFFHQTPPAIEANAPYLQQVQTIAVERKMTLSVQISRFYYPSINCSVSLRWEKDGETRDIGLQADTCEQAAKLMVERIYK